MSDPVAMNNWIVNSISALLVIEGVVEIVNSIYKKDQSTVHQARMWIRSILMITAAVILFWINRKVPVSLNLPKIAPPLRANNNGLNGYR